jgi:hypothetical protein
MSIKIATAAIILFASSAAASADRLISTPNGPVPFLSVPSSDNANDRWIGYFGAYARAPISAAVHRTRKAAKSPY